MPSAGVYFSVSLFIEDKPKLVDLLMNVFYLHILSVIIYKVTYMQVLWNEINDKLRSVRKQITQVCWRHIKKQHVYIAIKPDLISREFILRCIFDFVKNIEQISVKFFLKIGVKVE